MTMKHLVILLVATLVLASPSTSMSENAYVRVPPDGFVPDADTALKISEVVLVRIFGAEIDYEKPPTAKLENGVWIVKGTLPPHAIGGVAELHISKKDGTILFPAHGK
jgi:hypothetical protein